MMKLKRLIFLMVVPLVAAMGDKPDGEAEQRYVRGEVPAARAEAPARELPGNELSVLAASEADPAEFLWQARPVVIFADTAADPAFVEQLAALRRDPLPLLLRDVVVITDTDPSVTSPWRRQLRPEGFSLVLMDKDWKPSIRKPLPWDGREIVNSIDKMPIARTEALEKNPAGR